MLKYKKELAIAIVIYSALTNYASAADGTITINGKVTDTTCTIAIDGGSNDAIVRLPTVSSRTLDSAGKTAGATPFNISLSNCSSTSLNNASTYFEPGPYVDSETGRLNIDSKAPDAATNVQVELLNASRNKMVAGTTVVNGQNDVPINVSSGSGILKYFAQYYATGASTPGAVMTQVDYTIIYE